MCVCKSAYHHMILGFDLLDNLPAASITDDKRIAFRKIHLTAHVVQCVDTSSFGLRDNLYGIRWGHSGVHGASQGDVLCGF
jgi:hypothetical protein